MLAAPLLFILFVPRAASWQFQFNGTAVANASASVTWTRDADDSTTVGFAFRLRRPDVLPTTTTIPYWCQFGGIEETKGTFSVQFFTEGSYVAEAMKIDAHQTTNSSSDILGTSDIISVQAPDSPAPTAQDVLTLNFVAAKVAEVSNPQTTSTTTSTPSTTLSIPTTRSIVPVPSATLTPSQVLFILFQKQYLMSNRSLPSATASNNTAVVAGSVCGALGLVAIIAGVGIWIYRRRDGIPSPGEGDYYTTTPRPYTTVSTRTPVTVQSTTTSSRSPGKALTIRQALLRDRAEGLRAQVATLQQNNVEGRLMEENERQRRLILSLERQIRYLTEQQGSAWALGYTNEPPPSYVSGSSSGLA